MRLTRFILCASSFFLFVLPAYAELPDATDTEVVTVSGPFGAYTVTKTAQVWSPTNASNPCPAATPGFCYVYSLANDPGSAVGLIGFSVTAASGDVTDAGYLAGSGVAPDSTTVGPTQVSWAFTTTLITPGATSEHLYIDSPLGPSSVDATINGDVGLDVATTCLGPVIPPSEPGEPNPCTIGFWKNRAEGKKGLLKYFPDADFDSLVTAAVGLSTVFSDDDPVNGDLVTVLKSKGNRPVVERAKQQFAAFLLNVAAGDLFRDNPKCKLFLANTVDTDGDNVADLTIGEALTLLETNILSGDTELEHAALELADDINNGIGVEQ
jgi:hypothetical protein